MPSSAPSAGAAHDRRPGGAQVGRLRPQLAHARRIGVALRVRPLDVAHDLGDAEQADHQRQEVDAIPDRRPAEGVARHAGVDVGADEPEQEADQDHRQRLEHRAVRQHDRHHEAEHHQRKVVRRVELLREIGKRRREGRDEQRADAAGEERAERRHHQRRAGAALPRHLVAVEAGDDRRRLARHVDQDRGGRAAVLRAVIDAGEHDQRRQRIEPEGDRQQHGDGRDRADAGQHADQGAEQAADQGEAEIAPGGRRGEAGCEVLDDVHSAAPEHRQRLAERVDEHRDHEHRHGGRKRERLGEPRAGTRVACEQDRAPLR